MQLKISSFLEDEVSLCKINCVKSLCQSTSREYDSYCPTFEPILTMFFLTFQVTVTAFSLACVNIKEVSKGLVILS